MKSKFPFSENFAQWNFRVLNFVSDGKPKYKCSGSLRIRQKT